MRLTDGEVTVLSIQSWRRKHQMRKLMENLKENEELLKEKQEMDDLIMQSGMAHMRQVYPKREEKPRTP